MEKEEYGAEQDANTKMPNPTNPEPTAAISGDKINTLE